jgi:hypothetical protein
VAAVDAVTSEAVAVVVMTARLAGNPAKATGDSLTLKRPRHTEYPAGGASILSVEQSAQASLNVSRLCSAESIDDFYRT